MSALSFVRQHLPSHVLERPRLLGRLESAEAQVLAVIAPAGFGKTTLITQFAALKKQPLAWLTLNDTAADTLGFAGALAGALRLAFPRAKFVAFQAALEIGMMPTGLLLALAKDVNALKQNALIVLDRLERFSPDSARAFEAFLEDLHFRHRVVLAGYEGSAFPITRLVADGRAFILEVSDLVFTEAEARLYLQNRGFTGDITLAVQSLNGWAVGLALLASGSGLALRTDQLIFEVIKRLPLPLSDQIAELAVLEVWDELGATRLGCVLPSGWLKTVVNFGLPLQPLGSYQFLPHSVLSAALEILLQGRPARHAELHGNAAVFAERSGLLLEALRHFRLAGALPEVHRIAEIIVSAAVNREEFAWMRQLLESFEPAELSTRLQLRLVQALRQTGGLARADEILQQVRDSGVVDSLLYALMAIWEYNQGNFARQIELIHMGLNLESDLRIRTKLFMSLAAGLSELGRLEEDIVAAEEAVRCAELIGDQTLLASTLLILASSYGEIGRRVDCERLFLRTLEICTKLDIKARALSIYNNFANYLSDWGRLTEALDLVQKGLPLARATQSFWLALLLGTQGILHFRLGNYSAALRCLFEGIEQCKFFGLDGFAYNYRLFAIQAAVLNNDLSQAQDLLVEARVLRPGEASIQLNRLFFAEGMFAFAHADFVAAKNWLVQIDGVFDEFDKPRLQAYLAEITRREGSLVRAIATDLVDSTKSLGHSFSLALEEHLFSGLYQEFVRRNWYPEVFQEFCLPQNDSELVQLEVKLFEKPIFLISENQMDIPLAKSRELLAWLVVHGSSTRNELVAAIWGSISEQRNLEYFKIALRKLRASFYNNPSVTFDPIVFENGLYSLHPHLHIFCEAKRILDARDELPNEIAALETLFSSYQGDFMIGFDSTWVVELRQILLNTTLVIGTQLSFYWRSLDKSKEEEVLLRVSKIDPFFTLTQSI